MWRHGAAVHRRYFSGGSIHRSWVFAPMMPCLTVGGSVRVSNIPENTWRIPPKCWEKPPVRPSDPGASFRGRPPIPSSGVRVGLFGRSTRWFPWGTKRSQSSPMWVYTCEAVRVESFCRSPVFFLPGAEICRFLLLSIWLLLLLSVRLTYLELTICCVPSGGWSLFSPSPLVLHCLLNSIGNFRILFFRISFQILWVLLIFHLCNDLCVSILHF